MPRFTRAELDAFRGVSVPDLLPDGELKLLFVGINPGLWTAAVQTHFAHPVNRFYPALYEAGIITQRIDPAAGTSAEERARITGRGIGICNLVQRATARADELSKAELVEGAKTLVELVETRRPAVVAVAGITAYRVAFARPKAVEGRQPEMIGGSILWVVPNSSGLNAHETIASLARKYAEPARVAGVID
jgi:TDG/mug DNA glycosylase family protein